MASINLRKTFLDFFKKRGHSVYPSDSLVPTSDPSLLFTSAGMVQFKAHFLQQASDIVNRATSSQRCLRTTDIDQVGITKRHLTLFEMLGNFSFGDYFKEEAIAWAWEFFTKELNLPANRLYPSIYKDDEEAFKIWKKWVPESKIVRLGEADNFWTMGPTGPCGPCSEIYWDKEPGKSTKGPDDSDRWMEVWNLVFTQFDRQLDGSMPPLPKKNIDTGMGLERLTSVVEGVDTNFDTSLFKPIIQFGEQLFKYKYNSDPKKDVALRIFADHIRAVTLLVYDGILPSNEGRGYVLRRLLRRAVRQGAFFGMKEPFFYKAVPLVTDLFKDTAEDLPKRKDNIQNFVKQEEERFLETIETGTEKLNELVLKAKKGKQKNISGADAFRLYDTFGFPPELTQEILKESGMKFNQSEFQKEQDAAQQKAREGWKGSGAQDVTLYNKILKKVGATEFKGYDTLDVNSLIKAIIINGKEKSEMKKGDKGEIFTKESPFYPEGGGQVGDTGWLKDKSGKILAVVVDAQKPINNLTAHIVEAQTTLKVGDQVHFSVDINHRNPTKQHHTATHLLHAALRKVLGKSVTQAGSLVAPEKLRFDYTVNKPPSPEELKQVEDLVNDAIQKNYPSIPKTFTKKEAQKMGAMALFGEKYGDNVRCLIIGEHGFKKPEEAFSLELCGGTHCSASGDIGLFKIISDTSLAAGVRRMEALAGFKALEYVRQIESSLNLISSALKSSPPEASDKIKLVLERQKKLEQEIRDLKLKLAQGGNSQTDAGPEIQKVNGYNLAVKVSDNLEVKDLRTLADRMKQQIKSGIVFVASSAKDEDREKVSFIFAVTPDLKEKGLNAGNMAKAVAQELGGSGGGRPDFAQGGGPSKEKLAKVINNLAKIIQNPSH